MALSKSCALFRPHHPPFTTQINPIINRLRSSVSSVGVGGENIIDIEFDFTEGTGGVPDVSGVALVATACGISSGVVGSGGVGWSVTCSVPGLGVGGDGVPCCSGGGFG